METDPNLEAPLTELIMLPFELDFIPMVYSGMVVPFDDQGIEGLV